MYIQRRRECPWATDISPQIAELQRLFPHIRLEGGANEAVRANDAAHYEPSRSISLQGSQCVGMQSAEVQETREGSKQKHGALERHNFSGGEPVTWEDRVYHLVLEPPTCIDLSSTPSGCMRMACRIYLWLSLHAVRGRGE